jgi:hypothetical protein
VKRTFRGKSLPAENFCEAGKVSEIALGIWITKAENWISAESHRQSVDAPAAVFIFCELHDIKRKRGASVHKSTPISAKPYSIPALVSIAARLDCTKRRKALPSISVFSFDY